MSEFIDNHSRRRAALKDMIRKLHDGASVDVVRHEFATALAGVDATEIAALEQALIDEGLPQREVQRLCDVHVAAFRDTLDAQERPETAPGHPVYVLRAENTRAARVVSALEAALAAARWDEARARLADLLSYEAHYAREENILFPYLERRGFSGPSAVMWGIHDEIRAGWRGLESLLGEPAPDAARAAAVFGPLATAMREMFYKEENVLYPAALRLLTSSEWAAIAIQAQELAGQSAAAAPEPAEPAAPEPVAGLIPLQTGALTAQQIALVFTHLPVDVTFVDEHDTVQFFSATKDRIFVRPAAIIGRRVQQCHPPASVHRVQRILDDFRAGRRDAAEFWIQMGPKFVHISYFAVRDETGAYRGTLEVTQDATALRALTGERRLLDDN